MKRSVLVGLVVLLMVEMGSASALPVNDHVFCKDRKAETI